MTPRFSPAASFVARTLVVSGVCCALAAGCNQLSGVDDLVPVMDGDASLAGHDANLPPVDASAPPADAHIHDFDAIADGEGGSVIVDAGVVDANAGLCDELTMLFRLDGTTTSAQGNAPVAHSGEAFAPGKFGQALSAGSDTHLDYDPQSGKLASSSRGSVSMWINTEWPLPCDKFRPFWGVDDTGVYMDCEPSGYWGVYVDLTQNSGVNASIDPASVQSVWIAGWNHLVATWSSSPPSLTITLNGAVGQTTTAPWNPPDPTPTVFHLISRDNPALATVDDVAVWTRPLSAAEIKTIYLAGASVGDLCGLK